MSDPLSIAASIAGVATLGFAVAKGLHQIADGIGSAGEEVRMHGDEVAAFSKLIYHVRSEILGSSDVSNEAQSLLSDTVYLCNRVLHPLGRMLDTLKPLLTRFRSSDNKLRQFGLRLQWIFRTKDKLLFYRRALATQQALLQTLLDLIILQNTRDKSSQNVHILNISLQHSVIRAKATVYGTGVVSVYQANAERADIPAQPSVIDFGEASSLPGSSRANETLLHHASAAATSHDQNQESQIAADASESNNNEANLSMAITLFHPEGLDNLVEKEKGGPEELQNLSEKVDHDLDPDNYRSILAVTEDMRLLSPRIICYAAQELKSKHLELGVAESLDDTESII